jgi:hypothetical protein
MTTNYEKVLEIINELHVQNKNDTESKYKQFYLEKFLKSDEYDLWNKEVIYQKLQTAFSVRFHGIHFIDITYEPCIEEILDVYFNKQEHYLSYRKCLTHKKLILYPNYEKLKMNPTKILQPSYCVNSKLNPYDCSEPFVDFCFESF